MQDRYADGLERALADGLEPASAPESLWYRVDQQLEARSPASKRGMSRLALAFGVLLVGVVSVGWYLDKPVSQPGPQTRPAQVSRGEHACVLCHV